MSYGHNRQYANYQINGIPIIQAWMYYRSVIEYHMRITFCGPVSNNHFQYPVDTQLVNRLCLPFWVGLVWGKNFQCANLCMRMTSSTKCLRPVYLLYLSCFCLFVLQMGLLIHSRLHPEKTISSTELKKLGEIPFPAIFRICLKPAYNETFLRQAGYVTAWDLFTGSQMTQCKIKFTYQSQKTPIF